MTEDSWEETKISKWGHVPDREIDYKSATYKYNASEKYHELLSEYKIMHKAADGMFNGKSLLKFVDIIGSYLEKNDCISLLDYGAGKGILYSDRFKDLSDLIDKPLGELWNLDSYKLYDPAFEEHNTLPDPWEKGTFDAVICTDVLEHIPETDLKWVVDEILSYAGKMVFFNIACVPALKKFADGTNVHISVFEPQSWLNFFADMSFKYPELKLYLFFDTVDKETDKLVIEGYKLEMYPQVTKLEHK
jgi:hypothetical protein